MYVNIPAHTHHHKWPSECKQIRFSSANAAFSSHCATGVVCAERGLIFRPLKPPSKPNLHRKERAVIAGQRCAWKIDSTRTFPRGAGVERGWWWCVHLLATPTIGRERQSLPKGLQLLVAAHSCINIYTYSTDNRCMFVIRCN